jgi:hypothetical protein
MNRTIEDLAASFATLEGSNLGAGGLHDQRLGRRGFRLRLHAYTRDAVPLEFRARLLKPRAARLELHNTFFEWSDEWIEPDDTVFDLMYRSCDLIEATSKLGWAGAKARWATPPAHSVLQAQPVFDRQGWFRALQDRQAGDGNAENSLRPPGHSEFRA